MIPERILLHFFPNHSTVRQVAKLPSHIQSKWIEALVKEINGLIFKRKVFKFEDPLPTDQVVPLTEVFRAKLDKRGMIDKLKARVCFRGDLYTPTTDIDSYNPHADWLSLRIFLAVSAFYGIIPEQVDFVMAYVQTDMRERVFVEFPAYWAPFLPEEIRHWIGVPLLLVERPCTATPSVESFSTKIKLNFFRALVSSLAHWLQLFGSNATRTRLLSSLFTVMIGCSHPTPPR